MEWTNNTAFLILIIFLARAAINKVGRAMVIENKPAVEIPIYSGAPSSFRNKGTMAYIVWKATPNPQKNS